jgi:succinate dehydrogenase/fumarate reductase flavoprotein subunit
MADNVGPIRTGPKLRQALADIAAIATEAGERPPGRPGAFDLERLDWFDLRNMLIVAHAVAEAALNRTESRGAHQREDFPQLEPQWQRHQTVHSRGGKLQIFGAAAPLEAAAS